MNPDERKLLDRIANQVDENNTILRGIRRVQRFTTVYRILYWVLIIGLSFGAFYFIQPYVNMLKGVASGNLDQALNQSSGGGISDLLKGL